jgi:multicomponent Na+:H+ antiporter subunit E
VVNFFLILVAVMLVWSGLVFPVSFQEAIIGLLFSFNIAGIVYYVIKGKETFKPVRIGSFVLFSFIFARELIKANIDMAKIVLSPSLPISPKLSG